MGSKTKNTRAGSRMAATAIALGLAILPGLCPGQQTNAEKNFGGKKFSAVDYYKPPHDTQTKSLLQGGQGERRPDGHSWSVSELKIQTFREDGQRELLVEAPECLYDESQHFASSPGRLRVQTGAGELSIEGEGFLWQQTNSSLIISNDVHTMIHPQLLNRQGSPGTNSPMHQIKDLEIFSRQFSYTADSGLGIYEENVRVTGTNLSLTGGRLTIVVPVAERQLQSITADQDVVVNYEGVRASGDRVRYDALTDLVQISGDPTRQPSWSVGPRGGGADELLIDRTNKVFRATGHAFLKMPAQNPQGSGFLPGTRALTDKSSTPVEQLAEITCASYEIRTNSAVFQNQVRIVQRANGISQGTMSCDDMTVQFSGTNELQKIVAQKDVIIEQETNRFTAARAVYEATNGILELTGDPAWRAGLREGKGEVIKVNVDRNEMQVIGEASMRVPAEEMAHSSALSWGKTNRASPRAPERQFAEISSREYTVTPETAFFQGDVRADLPQMKWQCETINARFSGGAKTGRVVAEQGVVFDLTDEKVHGTSDKAVYTFGVTGNVTNDFVELTGNPVLVTTNGIFQNSNNVIVMNLAKQKLTAPGKFRITGTNNAASTNLLRAPKK